MGAVKHYRSLIHIRRQSVASKIGCTPETLRSWVKKMEIDSGTKPGIATDQSQRTKELEREVRELKGANEILRKAAAFYAQAKLDRKPKY
ncbi:MAG: transposase [Pseudomonadales bacterium]|nr:transposase [Pseudomonadales bacterium]